MAGICINNMSKISKSGRVHSLVNASYQVFENGYNKYIQINTYGTKERQNVDSPS